MQPQHLVLDLGCGTLRGGIPIIDYLNEENYTGIDVRDFVIKEAQKELKEEKLQHKKPELIHFSNFPDLKTDKKFDYILAFSVLFHLTDDILDEALEYVSKHLNTSSGRFYANVQLGTWQGEWEEFPLVARTFEHYTQLAKKHHMTVEHIGVLKDYGHLTDYDQHDLQPLLEFKMDTVN